MNRSLVVFTVLASVAPARAETLDHVYVITKGEAGSGPDLIIQHAPASQRAHARSLAQPLLDRYRTVEAELHVAADDPDAAVAMFVVGNIAAYRHTEIAESRIVAVVTAVRAAVHKHPDIVATSGAASPAVAQQYAIIGMLMIGVSQDATAQKIGEDSARNYVRTYLGLDIVKFLLPPPADMPAPTTPAPATPHGPVGKVQTVTFQYTMQMGVGGGFYYTPVPVVLFANGEALTDMSAMFDPSSKQSHPGWWTKWRTNGGNYEIATAKGGWTKLQGGLYDPLPAGTKLDHAYSSLGGGGNTAYGGGTTIASWRSIKFDRSGHFTNGGGMSASSQGTHGGVVVGRTNPDTSGTYEISGYTLTLRFDSGKVVQRAIVVDKKNAKVIWLDGTGYTS